MTAKLVVAVNALGARAIAGPITAGAVVYRATDVEPVFSYPDKRGRPRTSRFLSRTSKIPDALFPLIRDYLKKSAMASAAVSRSAEQIKRLGSASALVDALSFAATRAIERLAHTAPGVTAAYTPKDFVILVPEGIISASLSLGQLTQSASVDDWRLGAAFVLARAAHLAAFDELSLKYPGYGFERNNGHSTVEHKRAIRRRGVTPEHRRSRDP